MRLSLSICVVLSTLLGFMAQGDGVSFDEGHGTIDWSVDAQYVEITMWIDFENTGARSHMWILTVYSHRFADGVFAWQLHYSEDIDSVLVLPNDFLTARNFTTSQLGIEAALSDTGDSLKLRLPTLGTIPRLIAAGDRIEMHALWVKQPPLLGFIVPIPGDASAILPAGGGGSIVNPEVGSISTNLIPDRNDYVQGEVIAHRFALEDNLAADGVRTVLSYTLMRVHGGKASEFVRFAHIPFDLDTATYAYAIDTTALSPGPYRLLIDSANSPLSARLDLQIADPNP